MQLVEVNHKITMLLSQFVAEIKASSATGWTDANHASETLLIPLLSEVYGFRKLRNLNSEESGNFPAIDLGDEEARVAIQVTATPTAEKVKESLTKFMDQGFYETYSRLIVYVLTEKQKTYPKKAIDKIAAGRLTFSVDRDIIDYRDLVSAVVGFPLAKAESVLRILQEHFPDQTQREPAPEVPVVTTATEMIHSNLLRLTFPETIFIAELLPKEDDDSLVDNTGRGHGRARQDQRASVRRLLEGLGLKSSVDWVVFENSVLTFHDLSDQQQPLSKIVDPGTVTSLSPEEFYSVDPSQMRVFKALLKKCLQQKLFARQVFWQHRAKLFIFVDRNGEDKRVEEWSGTKRTHRVVYERYFKSGQPEATWYCKHFAFAPEFRSLGNDWFMLIKPDWFFSRDGYEQSSYSYEKVDWLKKREINLHVYNHLRFLCFFLSHDGPNDLFRGPVPISNLTFHDLVAFTSIMLDDKGWNPPRISDLEDSSEMLDEGQMELFGNETVANPRTSP